MIKYEKTTWVDGETVLKADHMKKIEKGIVDLCTEIENIKENGIGGGNANIDDTTISTETTWSSKKIKEEIDKNIKYFNSFLELDNIKMSSINMGDVLRVCDGLYEVSAELYDWSIPFENYYLNILNKDYVNYSMFKCPLNGIDDDTEGMIKAHAYCNTKKVLLKNNSGTIFKHGTDVIHVKYDMDLSGSTILVTNDNCYSMYLILNDDEKLYTYTTKINKSYLKQGTCHFPMEDNSLPSNCVLHIIDNNAWSTRNDAGNIYEDFRKELMFHNVFGICSGDLTFGFDDENTDLKVSYSYYNPKRLTIVGCKVRLETTPNVTIGTFNCKRHNTHIKDIFIDPKPNSIGNDNHFKNSVIKFEDCYNVEVSNISGINIAGKEATKQGSGYSIRFVNCYKATIRDCNINGLWGATAMNNVKDVYIENCILNRVDVHNYFSNLFIQGTTIYDWGVNIGCGTGILSFNNCKFVNLTRPNVGGQTLINLNNTYGQLFTGTISMRDIELITEGLDVAIVKLNYVDSTGDSRCLVKMPNVIVDNLVGKNISDKKCKLYMYRLSGVSDFSSLSNKIVKADTISYNNVSFMNLNLERQEIEFINDTTSKDMYDNNTSKTKISFNNIIFCDNPVPNPIIVEEDSTFLDLYTATNNVLSVRNDNSLMNNCDIDIKNCSLVLYNANSECRLYIDNSIIYAFNSKNTTNKNNLIFNNSTLSIFGYNLEYNRADIPIGNFVTCYLKQYNILKGTEKIISAYRDKGDANILNCSIDI